MKRQLFVPALLATAAGAGVLTLANAQDQARQPRVREFRYELRDDGSGPRLLPGGNQNQRRIQIEEEDLNDPSEAVPPQFRRFLEEGGRNGGGGGANPFRDLLQQLQEQQDQNGGRRSPFEQPGNPGKLMEEMMRRMGEGAHKLGFGPGRRDAGPSRYSKQHLSSLSEWRPLVKTARESTVRVLKDNEQVALATVVSADGYALTKASEVAKGDIECEFENGHIVAAKVVDKLESYDLALIKLEAQGLKPVLFADTEAPVGTLVAAGTINEDPSSVGVISVPARNFNNKTKGFLGIQMDVERESDRGILIDKIIPTGAAERAGLQSGDIILFVNKEEIKYGSQLQQLISGLKPDEVVTITYLREGKEQKVELSLGNRADGTAGLMDRRVADPTAQMGSTLSMNASGYPKAVQSDLTIQAEDCGGPVVSADGSVVGLNIAREERVSTLMIPGKVVNSLLTSVQSGKFTLAKDDETLHSELKEYDAAIRKAQEAMKEAEAKRNAAAEELQRRQPK